MWEPETERQREGLFTWGPACEVGRERHLGTERFDGTHEARWRLAAEPWSGCPSSYFRSGIPAPGGLGQVLSLLWVLTSASGK